MPNVFHAAAQRRQIAVVMCEGERDPKGERDAVCLCLSNYGLFRFPLTVRAGKSAFVVSDLYFISIEVGHG